MALDYSDDVDLNRDMRDWFDWVAKWIPPNRKWKDALARYNRKVRARSRRGMVWF